jgi:hypothetical protein
VEHLLRDINDPSLSTLSEQVRHKIQALKGLRERLEQMSEYLSDVIDKKIPVNKQIIYNIQVGRWGEYITPLSSSFRVLVPLTKLFFNYF